MNKIKVLSVLIASALQVLPALASTQPLPSTFVGSSTDYITFGNSAFPSSNLICFSAGCGGAFQGTVYGPGAVSATPPGFLATVWCVDYQLDVTTGSQYIANITTLNDINAATESNVRYGTLDSVSPPPPGWLNSVTDPSHLDGNDPNSAAYRYTLAAASVSQYIDSSNVADPTNLNGSSPVNTAIQEAIWYITYNNEYPADGGTWPPESDIGSATCSAGQSASNSSGNTNYACWVAICRGQRGKHENQRVGCDQRTCKRGRNATGSRAFEWRLRSISVLPDLPGSGGRQPDARTSLLRPDSGLGRLDLLRASAQNQETGVGAARTVAARTFACRVGTVADARRSLPGSLGMTNHLWRIILIAVLSLTMARHSRAETLTAARDQLVIGIVVVSAAITVGITLLILHQKHKKTLITGCVGSGAGGMNVTDENHKRIYALAGVPPGLKSGERMTLEGKSRNRGGPRPAFEARSVIKDLGACRP